MTSGMQDEEHWKSVLLTVFWLAHHYYLYIFCGIYFISTIQHS